MHVVLYLPPSFYAAIASSIVETLQTVNDVERRPVFTFELVSRRRAARSRSGIGFPTRAQPSRKIDVLIVLAGAGADTAATLRLHEEEIAHVRPLLARAQRQGAVIAGTCGAGYVLAGAGVLDGKRATIAWWLQREARRRFPRVQWQPSRMVVRHGRIYTSGGAFAGLDLLSTLLIDLGFAAQERQVRKMMVLPPIRLSQSPYELPPPSPEEPFARMLDGLAMRLLPELDLDRLAKELAMSPRTLARRFKEELQTTPGKWIQRQRLARASVLLESSTLTISEICDRVGYRDLSSFSRLFAKSTGVTPGEFRRSH